MHKEGRTHIVPDALSRWPDHQLNALSVALLEEDFLQQLDAAALHDAAYQEAVQRFRENQEVPG